MGHRNHHGHTMESRAYHVGQIPHRHSNLSECRGWRVLSDD